MVSIKSRQKAKKEKLLDKGVSLLLEKGYHASGLKEILETVQIPKGSFYTYFNSKEQFAAEAINHYIEPFIIRLTGLLQDAETDGLQVLKQYYDGMIAEIAASDYKGGCLLGNLMGEIGDTSQICRKALLEAVEQYSVLQAAALARGQRQGSVRQDLSAKTMADLLLNSWQGALLRMKIQQSIEPLQSCCDELLGEFFRVTVRPINS